MSTTNTEKPMTMRDFLNAVANEDTLPDAIHDFAVAQLSKLDGKNSSRASKNAEKTAEKYAPIIEKITALLNDASNHAMLTSEIAINLGLSTSTVSAAVKKMGDAVTTAKVKVPKVGERVQITLVTE